MSPPAVPESAHLQAPAFISARPDSTQRDNHKSDPLEEHLSRPKLSRISPATQATMGPIGDEWLRDNLVAIAQLAESLDRGSFELAMRIVPIDWWQAQLPDRPSTAESLRT